MSPVRWFIAENWPLRIWMVGAAVVWVQYLRWAVNPSRELFGDWRFFLSFAAITIASFGVAILSACLLAALLLGPFYRFQAHLNGAPFEPGDEVRILSGKERGRVTRVYSLWQGGTVRVEISESAKSSFKDIYGGHQLLLVSRNVSAT
ncbi:MAG: hypothetical protein ACXVJT_05410 [Thermoanaerobaculia bacterium]